MGRCPIKRLIAHTFVNPHTTAHPPIEKNSAAYKLVLGTELSEKQSRPCLLILVQLVDALHLGVVAGLDPVKLLSLLFQLALELVLLQLHGASLCGRPADPAFQLHDPRLQGYHRVRANVKPSLETRPPEPPQQRPHLPREQVPFRQKHYAQGRRAQEEDRTLQWGGVLG